MPDEQTAQEIQYPYYEVTVTETTWHYKAIHYLEGVLEHRYSERTDVFVGANNFVYLEEGNTEDKQSPDVYLCFGASNRDRRSYRPWDEGGVFPQVVFEVSSRSSRFHDLGDKKALYEAMGVEEYYVFDPLREYIPQGLRAFRRKDAAFQELVLPRDASSEIRVFSPRIQLDLAVDGPLLRFFEPDQRDPLPNYKEARLREEQAKMREEQAKLREEQAKLREEQAKLREEQALLELEAARAELAELRRQLGQS